MHPHIWGPHLWFFIHTLCLETPVKSSVENKNYIKNFFLNLQNIIPCEQSKEHYNQNLSTIPNIDASLDNENDSLFYWSVQLHNSVNKMLGKKEWTNEEAYNYYKYIFEEKRIYSYGTIKQIANTCPELNESLNISQIKIKTIFQKLIYMLVGVGVYLLYQKLFSKKFSKKIFKK